VYSSITTISLMGWPSSVRSKTKSYDQAWLRRSGLSRMHEPSVVCLLSDADPLADLTNIHPLTQ